MKFLLVTKFITGCSEALGTPPRVCSFLSPPLLQAHRVEHANTKPQLETAKISQEAAASEARLPDALSSFLSMKAPGAASTPCGRFKKRAPKLLFNLYLAPPCPQSFRSFSRSWTGHRLSAEPLGTMRLHMAPYCLIAQSKGTVVTLGLAKRRMGLVRNWPKSPSMFPWKARQEAQLDQ